jgi:hypothetical protein
MIYFTLEIAYKYHVYIIVLNLTPSYRLEILVGYNANDCDIVRLIVSSL